MKTLMVVILLLTFLLSIIFVVISLTRRDRKQPVYFAVLTIATALYILGYLLEITAPDYSGAVTALKVQNVGIPLLGPFFMMLILRICDSKLLKGWMPVAGGIYAGLIFLSVFFNDHLRWYYTDIRYVVTDQISYLVLDKGPLYLFNQAVVTLCVVAAFVVLLRRFRVWKPRVRKQMAYVAVGSLFSFSANVINFLGLVPNMLDITPFVTLVTMLLYTVSIVRYRLFEVIPIASEVALQTMDDAMVVLNDDWCFVYCNDSAARMFPSLRSLNQFYPITKVGNWPEVLRQKQSGQTTFHLTDEAGATRHYRARINSFDKQSKGDPGWAIVIRDITELHELLDQMEVLATTDPLTGIWNRRHFIEIVMRELEAAKRHPHPMALIMFDLDHFKVINDTHGHLVGDTILQAITKAVKRELRPYDMFARYGGEEFIIFSTQMDEGSAEKMAWRLCRVIENLELQCRRTPIRITASFGVSQMYARDSIEAATAAADKALYRAKADGRNCVRVGRIERDGADGQLLSLPRELPPEQDQTSC